MREFGRFAQCSRRILSIASRSLSIVDVREREPVIAQVSVSPVLDRLSARGTEDQATRLEVRMAVSTVAAVFPHYGKYTRSVLEKLGARCDN